MTLASILLQGFPKHHWADVPRVVVKDGSASLRGHAERMWLGSPRLRSSEERARMMEYSTALIALGDLHRYQLLLSPSGSSPRAAWFSALQFYKASARRCVLHRSLLSPTPFRCPLGIPLLGLPRLFPSRGACGGAVQHFSFIMPVRGCGPNARLLCDAARWWESPTISWPTHASSWGGLWIASTITFAPSP